MPKLNELGKRERVEICRTIARAAHDCLADAKSADGCILGGSFDARVYKAWSELGVIEDEEFYGNSFSKERVKVLEGFQLTYEEALTMGNKYDECIAPLVDISPNFAMKSEALVRMRCVSSFCSTLLGDGPFADLHVTLCVAEDDDDGNAVQWEAEAASSSDDEDCSNDSIVASSSDEEGASGSGSASESGSGSGSEENEDRSDVEEATADEAGSVGGPRRKKARVRKARVKTETQSDDEFAEENVAHNT